MLVVMVGLPGSGKSTYASANYACIVSPDRIRREQFGTAFDPDVEHDVWRIAFQRVRAALEGAAVVCFDATSVSRRRRARLIDLAQEAGAPALAVWINTSPEQAWARNRARDRSVPRSAFQSLLRAFEPPSLEEGFSLIVRVRPGGPPEPGS